ncbi:hypothetical protein KEM09_17405 [Carboxylicivirga mesophila]|uniref:DUF1641 domain-containing protein n=1 Tax=Carboxylicivirga mesophila TaxID=1166478 RepID=A0ABS5KDS6_9BACT|nr:hypothetical protein [Carboxylicivirga mesophila]MBS2213194.1 hypothetical protein [Carboxylicivirga mesophila]
MQENRIELNITDEEQAQVNEAINVLEQVLLPKLYVLEKDEKADLLHMGDKSVAFVDKSLEIARQDEALLDAFVDVSAMAVDVGAVSLLRSLSYKVERIASALEDSKALAGHEAYSTSLMVYSLMKNAAKMGHPGAKEKVAELKQRFPRGRKKAASVN